MKASHSRSSSSVAPHDRGCLGRSKAREKDSMPRSGSWWTLVVVAGAVSAGTAAEMAVPGQNAHAHAHAHVLGRTAHDNCDVGPCRPDGYGGQSCEEQIRRLQTSGEWFTDENQASFCPVRSLSVCVPWKPVGRVDQNRRAALQNERPLPASQAQTRQPGSGPGAQVSHRGTRTGEVVLVQTTQLRAETS